MRSQHILHGGCDKGMTLLQQQGALFEALEWKEGIIGDTGVYCPVKHVTRTQLSKNVVWELILANDYPN